MIQLVGVTWLSNHEGNLVGHNYFGIGIILYVFFYGPLPFAIFIAPKAG